MWPPLFSKAAYAMAERHFLKIDKLRCSVETLRTLVTTQCNFSQQETNKIIETPSHGPILCPEVICLWRMKSAYIAEHGSNS